MGKTFKIGRSAISGRFMSVARAQSQKRTAIVQKIKKSK